ncbi:MAG: type II/IV secretion system ATPase subunit [archaeon]
MVYTKEQEPYKISKEGEDEVLTLNYEDKTYSPSIEDNPIVMMDAIDKLIENPSITRLVFYQRRNYNYDYNQTKLLAEIAKLYIYYIKNQRVMTPIAMGLPNDSQQVLAQRFEILRYTLFTLLKTDPLGAYVELKRQIRMENINLKRVLTNNEKDSIRTFINILTKIYESLDSTALVNKTRDQLAGYNLGDRTLYKSLFKPTITPDFMYTKIMSSPPLEGEQLEIYKINNQTDVTIFNVKEDIKKLYHIHPPEFKLTEDKYALIEMAKSVLSEHKPREEEFLDPEKMRNTFSNIGKDLLRDLANQQGLDLSQEELEELSEILVRHTIGFGVLELILQDKNVQDVTINAPPGQSPMFVLHQEHDECFSNIHPSKSDYESWATKFRLLSGRPLDEANPILDTELVLPHGRSRVSIITKPLNPFGYAYSFRRHRDTPWTLPLFIKVGMISPLAAGLLSFCIDGSRTHLIAGTRSSGKTSLLGALLLEILRRYRILTVEDTLELPTSALRKLGYNIQPLKVRSALLKGGSELEASEGIRASLRMGDSALIVGEIRSGEALALYEAMRIGALANVVAGTIHGDSPYGVFDRVVNDLKVPRTSFKATDIMVICNPIRSADGLHKWRRVTSITEVRKTWEEDPLRERGFVDLMKYNSKTDMLEPTPDLINGESEVLKSIGANVKEWVGDWDSIWENVQLRADLKKMLVDYAENTKKPHILEAPFATDANDMQHRISDIVKEEVGSLDPKMIKDKWEDWLKERLKKE